MQRIMNDPDNIVDEMLQGFLKTHSDLVESCLLYTSPSPRD